MVVLFLFIGGRIPFGNTLFYRIKPGRIAQALYGHFYHCIRQYLCRRLIILDVGNQLTLNIIISWMERYCLEAGGLISKYNNIFKFVSTVWHPLPFQIEGRMESCQRMSNLKVLTDKVEDIPLFQMNKFT